MKELDHEKMNQNNESKRPYCSPDLIKYGDIRSLTLGGTPGTGDTAPGTTTEDPLGAAVEEEEPTNLNE